ncbi:hypothetical protein PF005_g23919 [Phytophthora fragariae]|uniref:RxLR effector protein n=1 Tax=Phytophthora fragariae TaxID=53985 RepID=A0A6A3W4H0_9STRA|nr:hypothetical protein PF003_g26621 [Phytophthora fragariae]KAE8925018.1 hypothetical protein PF009_g24766 [Phytophthora fragariae]KAE8979827.1 hypothetical protein PF011_g22687 [Phytophthora fragariae]KAE9077805.1 hypothetical protein PF010_g23374 [Phytophthora fragariae]KAE9078092.1 hypothetical protein PF007_g23999 [Phytophthora fragariae]
MRRYPSVVAFPLLVLQTCTCLSRVGAPTTACPIQPPQTQTLCREQAERFDFEPSFNQKDPYNVKHFY